MNEPLQTLCIRIRLKPDSLTLVREWAGELSRRRDEVLETLADEGVHLEMAFLDSTAEGDWLVYVMRARDLQHAREVFAASRRPIDLYHRAFVETTWDQVQMLEPLLIVP